MIDWLDNFLTKFGAFKEIQTIKQNKLHGSLTINFCEGLPQNYNLSIHRRAIEMNDNLNNLNNKENNGEAKV